MLEHRVLVPNYNAHVDPNYVPGIIASKLNDNIEEQSKIAIEEFNAQFVSMHDVEDQVNRFNAFCHELRCVLKK